MIHLQLVRCKMGCIGILARKADGHGCTTNIIIFTKRTDMTHAPIHSYDLVAKLNFAMSKALLLLDPLVSIFSTIYCISIA